MGFYKGIGPHCVGVSDVGVTDAGTEPTSRPSDRARFNSGASTRHNLAAIWLVSPVGADCAFVSAAHPTRAYLKSLLPL